MEIVYVDQDGDRIDEETLEKIFQKLNNLKLDVDPLSLGIDKKYIEAADTNTLTRKMLLEMDYTDLLRFACYSKASPIILEEFKIRGLPLKAGFKILPHQIRALKWMKDMESTPQTYNLRGGIVSMVMGLGKTLVALAHILTSKKGKYPSLVVVSKTVMYEWKSQGIDKFFGDEIKVLYFHFDFVGKEIKEISRADIVRYDVVIATYDTCMTASKGTQGAGSYVEQCYEMWEDGPRKGKKMAMLQRTRKQADLPDVVGIEILYGTPWERVICDESQRFANPTTSTFESMMALYGRYKWCLTGTPVRNYDTDIWAQLRFCGYDEIRKTSDWHKYGKDKYREHKLIQYIFSMSYDDAQIKLPPKSKYRIAVNLDGRHKEIYDYMIKQIRKEYNRMLSGLVDFACILALFIRLRQCVISPYLLTATAKSKAIKQGKQEKQGKEGKQEKEGKEGKQEKQAHLPLEGVLKQVFGELNDWCYNKREAGFGAPKIKEIIKILKKLDVEGDGKMIKEKILVFSSFTTCLDLVREAVKDKLPKFGIIQVDGETKGLERSKLLQQFKEDPNTQALLLTYKVGSEGLNLTEATHVICIDPWWTPAVHRQAEHRCWRVGQTKNVNIHNIFINDSIEERILDICKSKEELTAYYMEGTSVPMEKGAGLDKYTMGKILGLY